MIFSAALSSYIFTNRVSSSLCLFSAFFSSDIAFFFAKARSLSPFLRAAVKAFPRPVVLPVTSIADGKGHRHKAHHSECNEPNNTLCQTVRSNCKKSNCKGFCSVRWFRTGATSRSLRILPVRRKSACSGSFAVCACSGFVLAPAEKLPFQSMAHGCFLHDTIRFRLAYLFLAFERNRGLFVVKAVTNINLVL